MARLTVLILPHAEISAVCDGERPIAGRELYAFGSTEIFKIDESF